MMGEIVWHKSPQKTNTSCSLRKNYWYAEVNSKRTTKERNKEDIKGMKRKGAVGLLKS